MCSCVLVNDHEFFAIVVFFFCASSASSTRSGGCGHSQGNTIRGRTVSRDVIRHGVAHSTRIENGMMAANMV